MTFVTLRQQADQTLTRRRACNVCDGRSSDLRVVVGDQAEVCLDDRDGTLDEREAMALEGGVSSTFARLFAVLQVARPASVNEDRWYQAINDAGLFLDEWGQIAERLGWSARDLIGPAYTPAALAWSLQGRPGRDADGYNGPPVGRPHLHPN